LLPVRGKPIIQYLVNAINNEFSAEKAAHKVVVAIATSERTENLEFSSAVEGCEVFTGSDENIPLRHLQAAEYFSADAIISVDGDDILCSPAAMRGVFIALLNGALFAKTEGLPLGMNASGYATAVLRKALEKYEDADILETGWGRVFEGVPVTKIEMLCIAPENLRFTLDYEEDFKFFNALIHNEAIASRLASDLEIVSFVMSHKLDSITQPVVEKYWENFYNRVDMEKGRSNT